MWCNVKFTIQIVTPPVPFICLAYPGLLEADPCVISFGNRKTDLFEFCGREEKKKKKRKADMETLTIVHGKNGEATLPHEPVGCMKHWA